MCEVMKFDANTKLDRKLLPKLSSTILIIRLLQYMGVDINWHTFTTKWLYYIFMALIKI
jgi:hypothetical protein